MELTEEQKLNQKVESYTGNVCEFLGVALLTISAMVVLFAFTLNTTIATVAILGFLFIALGKALHYLRKTSLLTEELLKHLKEKDKK